MKAIQFKQVGNHVGNSDEVLNSLGVTITYSGSGRGENPVIQKTCKRDNLTHPIQFDDWIIDIKGVVFILNDEQYQILKSLMSPKKT